MRLLVFGHWSHTGFGIVTRELAERFVAAGVDVRIIAVNHRGDPVRGPLAGRVWPAGLYGDQFGGNWSHAAISGEVWGRLDPDDEWKPDQVLVVSDPSGLMGHLGSWGLIDPAHPEWTTVPVWHYCPIEGDNLSLGWKTLWEHIRPVAMSDFGQRQIATHIGAEVPRIYHGVDTETFHPVAPTMPIRFRDGTISTKEACRVAFGLPQDAHIILRYDRNVTRKRYPDLFRVFTGVALRDPKAMLVIHCRPQDPEGPNLIEDYARMPERVRERVVFTQAHDTFTGLPTSGLVTLINAADLYVSTTGGEGFGLTLAESIACGVPVVCTGWAAEVETVGPGGILVPPLRDSYGEPVRDHSVYGMDWAVPDVEAFVAPIVRLLEKPAERRMLGLSGRVHVRANFSWDTAAAEFLTLFDSISQEAAA